MGSWSDVLNEINVTGSSHDVVRRKYLAELHALTGRNVIAYYSGWLQKEQLAKTGARSLQVNDSDKNGFMAAIHKMDRTKGLDLILHTPGGEVAATESLVHYLRSMFQTDIRAIIPQLAMSCGTMIALASKQILMGKHSNLGPIDPQFGAFAAHGIIEEFERAKQEIQKNNIFVHVWQPIIAKYNPTLIGECEKAIKWSGDMTTEWLKTGMFNGQEDAATKAEKIVKELGDHSLTMSHGRHIPPEKAKDLGIEVVSLEDDERLQEAILNIHHACILTLSGTGAVKIIENHLGSAYIETVQQ